jgi:hypothetical protein
MQRLGGTGCRFIHFNLWKEATMEPVYFVLAILGCGDDGSQCSQQRVEPARYESAAQCQAAMPAALQRSLDVEYPVVTAACQQSGERFAADKSRRPNG